jgi:hypothetical protein
VGRLSDRNASMYLPRRINEDGIKALAATFAGIPVLPIKIPQSMHWKTGICFPTSETRETHCDPALGANASDLHLRVM